MKVILSLGAGVQSSTLALMLKHGCFPQFDVDCALFADTQAEPRAVYNWLDWLEKQLTFPVHRVTRGSLREDSLIMRKSKKTGYVYLRTLIPMFTEDADGSKRKLIRKCTADYKLQPLFKRYRDEIGSEALNEFRRKYQIWQRTDAAFRKRKSRTDSQWFSFTVPFELAEKAIHAVRKALKVELNLPETQAEVDALKPEPLVRQLIGISYDEVQRMRTSEEPWIINEYPLVNLRMTRQDCLKWMEEHGYPKPPRSACTFCPFQSNDEWRNLKENSPEEWARVVAFEKYQQRLQAIDQRLEGQIFLHASCKPIDEVDFGGERERGRRWHRNSGMYWNVRGVREEVA